MKKNMNINRGAAFISFIFALLFFLLVGRFIYIQGSGTADGVVLASIAEEKYTKKRIIEAERGTIYDRNGNPVAEDTAAYTIVAILDEELTVRKDDPQHVVDPEETAEKIAPLINMDVSEMLEILKKDKKQVEFGSYGRDISHKLKQEIEALKLPGIAFRREMKRYYPYGTFASHLIGYAQKDPDEEDSSKNKTVGKLGLEKSLDKYLQETDGFIEFKSDKKGYKLPDSNEQIVAPDNGSNVYLTIDKTIQTFLEDAMNNAVKEYKPEKVIGIVADPKTGEILAMSTRPSFDPNKRDIENYLNDTIAYPYEPGSTMKIFTLAAAIEEGVYNGESTFASGRYEVAGRTIRDHNYSGWGTITYDEGVFNSSNVAFAKIAKEQLGTDRLREYISRFGLDKPTGIDIPGEVENSINFKYPQDQVSTAFGQASSVTPIQQIQAATAIANGGKMMKPYVIDKIIDPDTNETLVDHEPKVSGKPVSKETTEKVRDLLSKVVTEGTGKLYNLEGYEVAGKTGTAEIANPEGGYFSGKGNYFYSFLGMAPKDDPQLIVYIAVKKPKLKELEFGAEPVAAIFNPVMKNSLQYLNIKPSEQKEGTPKFSDEVVLDDFIGSKPSVAKEKLDQNHQKSIVIGNGDKIIMQSPSPGETVIANEKVLLVTNSEIKLPNLIGWSLRDVLRLSSLLDLEISYEGNGFVKKQSIPADTIIKQGDQLKITLETPSKSIEKAKETKKEKNDKN